MMLLPCGDYNLFASSGHWPKTLTLRNLPESLAEQPIRGVAQKRSRSHQTCVPGELASRQVGPCAPSNGIQKKSKTVS